MDLELQDRAFLNLPAARTDSVSPSRNAWSPKVRSWPSVVVTKNGSKRRRCCWDQTRSAKDRTVTNSEQLDEFIQRHPHAIWSTRRRRDNAGRSAGTASIATSVMTSGEATYELKVIALATWPDRSCPPWDDDARGDRERARDIGAHANANTTPTSASRLAGLALTKSLASEVGPRGIRCERDFLIGLIESGQWVRRAATRTLRWRTSTRPWRRTRRSRWAESGRTESSPTWPRSCSRTRASYVTASASASTVGCRPSSDAPLDRNSE